ncbi:hypothetical protein JCM10908_002727 [Rhodotorula pacifica]|uniref:protein-tyrosine phosphatase Siw14 family protein n=1 Tax=Rhodotorula pacifica TaxID=1495444 RepID=UPI00316D7883
MSTSPEVTREGEIESAMTCDDAMKKSSRSCGDDSGSRLDAARPTSKVPLWMYKLMCERGSHQPPERSRSRRRNPSDHLGHPSAVDVPATPDSHTANKKSAGTSTFLLAEPAAAAAAMTAGDADSNSCDTIQALPPVPSPSTTTAEESLVSPEAIQSHHLHRPACRDSYGDFSSASSTASSSTSYSGFDSRSASSITSASSATTFSAAGWNGQSSSPSASSSSFGGRKRSPAGFRARGSAWTGEEREGKVSPPSLDETTLCLSRLAFPSTSTVDVHTPDDADLTPLASTSRLSSHPHPVSPTGASQISLETTATEPSPPAPIPSVDDGTLLAPENFATVSADLYRSSFPRKDHFPFLKSLGLKSVMVLVQEPYPEENAEFLEKEGIQLFQFGIPGNKEPFVSIPDDKVVAALTTILDKRNHPMLIHCNKGKHRTGCVVGCLRRIQSWSLTSIFDEYRRYSTPKSRAMDLQFIEAFAGLPDVWRLCNRDQLPRWPTLEPPPLPEPSDPPARPP